jgi:hypothetical protein
MPMDDCRHRMPIPYRYFYKPPLPEHIDDLEGIINIIDAINQSDWDLVIRMIHKLPSIDTYYRITRDMCRSIPGFDSKFDHDTIIVTFIQMITFLHFECEIAKRIFDIVIKMGANYDLPLYHDGEKCILSLGTRLLKYCPELFFRLLKDTAICYEKRLEKTIEGPRIYSTDVGEILSGVGCPGIYAKTSDINELSHFAIAELNKGCSAKYSFDNSSMHHPIAIGVKEGSSGRFMTICVDMLHIFKKMNLVHPNVLLLLK